MLLVLQKVLAVLARGCRIEIHGGIVQPVRRVHPTQSRGAARSTREGLDLFLFFFAIENAFVLA